MLLHSYTNGDYRCELYSDGSLVRSWEADNPRAAHPCSIDIKVTDYCNAGCKYCHEMSTTKGKHGDLDKLLKVLEPLPGGVELAIGGGNPLSHPHLTQFLQELKRRDIIANITINQLHVKPFFNYIKDLVDNELVKGIGISINSKNYAEIVELNQKTDHVVYHVIAGVNDLTVIDELIPLSEKCKVLVLGYKQFGRGIVYYNEGVQRNIDNWFQALPKYFGKCTLSFDNLALEQLKIKRFFTESNWDQFFMGEDGQFTMYIDAVKEQYAKTSRTAERVDFSDQQLLSFFNSLTVN